METHDNPRTITVKFTALTDEERDDLLADLDAIATRHDLVLEIPISFKASNLTPEVWRAVMQELEALFGRSEYAASVTSTIQEQEDDGSTTIQSQVRRKVKPEEGLDLTPFLARQPVDIVTPVSD